MSKVGLHCSFGHLKHKLWPKEGPGVKLVKHRKKSRIDPIYLCAENVRHTVGKLLTRATTLLQTASRSEVYSQSYGAPKSRESLLARFRDSHSGVSREKSHLDVGPVERCRIYYKGEGGGFPQVQAMVSLVCPCCPWLILAPKVLQLCTNHLVWVVCKPVWVSEACQLFLVPSRSFNTPLYPSKCCELGSVPRFLPLPISCIWIHFWVLQGVGSVSHPLKWKNGWVFFVKFVIAILSSIVVLKPLPSPPSFSTFECGWGIFFKKKFVGNTLRLCRWYCYFKGLFHLM